MLSACATQEYKTYMLTAIERKKRQKGGHIARASLERARQFMPFAALKGFDSMLGEAERLKEPRKELCAEQAEALNWELQRAQVGDNVKLTVYVHDRYLSFTGRLSIINQVTAQLYFDDIFQSEQQVQQSFLLGEHEYFSIREQGVGIADLIAFERC